MPTADDVLRLASTGVIVLSLVAIMAILATARGAYAAPTIDASAYELPAPSGTHQFTGTTSADSSHRVTLNAN